MDSVIYQLGVWTDMLPEHLHREMLSRTHFKNVDKGDFLYHQSQALDFMYEVQSGSLELCNFLENGECFVAGILKPGDWGGELTHVLDIPPSYSGIAREPLTVRILPKAELKALRQQYPEFNAALLDKVARRLVFYVNRFEANTRMSVSSRILWLLNWLQTSHGERSDDGTLVIKDIQIKDFYRMIGAARQTVSKEFHRLAERGIFETRKGEIVVLDEGALISELENKN